MPPVFPRPPSGQSLSPAKSQRTISLWDNPHITMKIKSLIPALAALTFAVTASAQSDPSTGGSFGRSFDRGAPADNIVTVKSQSSHRADAHANRSNVQNRSFWDKMTGRNKSIAQSGTSRNHSWFHRTNDSNRSWFGHRTNTHMQNNNPAWRKSNVNHTTNRKNNGWHMPFFHRS